MRNWLVLLGGGIFLLLLAAISLYLTGMAMPGSAEHLVEVDLPAPPERVHPLLVRPDGLGRWLDGVAAAGGSAEGTGLVVTTSDPLASRLTVARADPLAVEYALERAGRPATVSIGLFPTEDGTRLQWFETRDLGSPYARWWDRSTGVEDHSAQAIRDALTDLQRAVAAP